MWFVESTEHYASHVYTVCNCTISSFNILTACISLKAKIAVPDFGAVVHLAVKDESERKKFDQLYQ